MNSDKNIPRILGAAFVFVWVASSLSSNLLESAIGFEFGSGSISKILVNISDNVSLMRVSILVELVNGIGTVVVAVLLHAVLHKQNKIISLLALGWWLACVIVLAVSKIGSFALIPLSLEFVEAGAPASSFYQTLGNFLYHGMIERALIYTSYPLAWAGYCGITCFIDQGVYLVFYLCGVSHQ